MDEELRKLLRQAENARRRGASVDRINEELEKLTDGGHTFRSLADLAASEGVPLRGASTTSRAPSGEPTPEDEALQRINERGGSAVGDAARMAGQGLSFGLLDEVIGAGAAVGAMVPGGRSPGEAFRETRDASRQRVEDLRTTTPVASWLAEGAGAVASGAGAARLASKVPAVAAAARAHPVAATAAGGAAIGAAEGEGVRGRAGGAALGAGLGAVGAAAAKAAPALARGARRAMTRSGRAAEESATTVAGSLDEAAERIGPLLEGAVEDAGLSPGLLGNRPAALRKAFEEAGDEGAERVRAGILRSLAEDLEAGDVAVSELSSRSGLSRLREVLPEADYDRVSGLLSEEASAEAISRALRSAFKLTAGAGAGLGLLDAVLGG